MKLRKSLSLLLCTGMLFSLTACTTSAGTNAELYLSNVKRILFTSTDTGTASSSSSQSSAATLAAPANLTVDGDNYSFDGVDGASQYLVYLCEAGSTDDNDSYIYSGVIEATGEASYQGNISEAVPHAYGEYTLKVFAMTEDYTMSAASTAAYSTTGELPAPDVAWSWDGQGVLTLQLANADDYDYAAAPDAIDVTITGADGEHTASFDSTLADITVEGLTEGDYTASAHATSSSAYVTSANSAEGTFSMSFGAEKVSSDNYVAPMKGGGGGGEGWTVKPTAVTFAENAESFGFVIGSPDFLKTTAQLQAEPDEGSTYTYVLQNGDAAAPFAAECIMKLQIKADGTTTLTVTAAGPLSATTVNGTWTAADGNITLAW